jgi:cytochrome c-type biogenesis protein CcmH/NrfG
VVAGIGYRLCFWLGVGGMASLIVAGIASQWIATGSPPSLEQHPVQRALAETLESDSARRISEHRAYAAIQPRDAKAFMKLGTTLAHNGDDAEAMRAFETAISLHPVPAGAHSKLATLYFRTGRVDAAREQARIALERGAAVNPGLLRKLGIQGPQR